MKKQILSAVILFGMSGAALADDLTPLPAPDARPYPYKILDIQPGQIGVDIVPQIEQHLGGSLTPVIMQQAVTSPQGRQFEADITTGYETMGVSLHTRMGEQPYEEVLLTTATPVLEGRVIKIWRNMRQPNADLPDPAELTAQLEDLYGPPSWVGPDPIRARTIKYVWTPSGQLAPQQEEPCSGSNYGGYSFDNDREPVAPPECSAVFTMTDFTTMSAFMNKATGDMSITSPVFPGPMASAGEPSGAFRGTANAGSTGAGAGA